MTNIDKLKIGIQCAIVIDDIKNISGIAIISLKSMPESYTFVKDVIMGDYRISIYNMNKIGRSYVLDVHGLCKFQIL
jgi:hypothetical protein